MLGTCPSILTLAVEKPEAACYNIFNCVSDRAVTLDGMARLCAEAASLPVEIVHYDPKAAYYFSSKKLISLQQVKQFI